MKKRLYFIYSPQLGVKIGVSKDPWGRMRGMGLPSLKLMATIACPKPRELEKQLHRRFAHLRRGNKEWFRPAPELMRYIESVRG